jgi:hypothetical protein
MIKFNTANGGTMELTRVGSMADIHVKDASGRTIATVTMSNAEARDLIWGKGGEAV